MELRDENESIVLLVMGRTLSTANFQIISNYFENKWTLTKIQGNIL